MDFNEAYSKSNEYFGSQPEQMLCDYLHLIKTKGQVLDIGAGQGRNALYLAKKEFQVDALDPSETALDQIRKTASEHNLKLTCHHTNIASFQPPSDKTYDALLLFGLIQILSRDAIKLTIQQINNWFADDGLFFVAAFSTDDPSIPKYAEQWKTEGENSFTDGKGEYRTFLKKNEVLQLFGNLKPIHHWEGMGEIHRHGDGPSRRHSLVHVVLQAQLD